jgi:hypothetical protein
MSSELDDICERLQAISERLGDLALDRLREAIEDGATKTPVEERRLTRARRAVDKAISVLAAEEAGDPSD